MPSLIPRPFEEIRIRLPRTELRTAPRHAGSMGGESSTGGQPGARGGFRIGFNDPLLVCFRANFARERCNERTTPISPFWDELSSNHRLPSSSSFPRCGFFAPPNPLKSSRLSLHRPVATPSWAPSPPPPARSDAPSRLDPAEQTHRDEQVPREASGLPPDHTCRFRTRRCRCANLLSWKTRLEFGTCHNART